MSVEALVWYASDSCVKVWLKDKALPWLMVIMLHGGDCLLPVFMRLLWEKGMVSEGGRKDL